VTYTDELLELIYEKALARLVADRQYPAEMGESGAMKYDPLFSIRGLAVDKETGWITHLSYTHKVAVAWEGREKLPTRRIFEEYRGTRALTPNERKKRLKPLNDLFSMAECCLIADTIQFFKDRGIPYCPRNVVTDVLNSVTATHLSGEFHRMVAAAPERYLDPAPHLKDVLLTLKESGKRLIFVSNSPFWYVDAGMRYMFGGSWRNEWDAIITSKWEVGNMMLVQDACWTKQSIKQLTHHTLLPPVL
jgi:HAD superfamily 5'-nucleotidase-like hydrolase